MSTFAAAFIVGWACGSGAVLLWFAFERWMSRRMWRRAHEETLRTMDEHFADDPVYQRWRAENQDPGPIRTLDDIEADLRAYDILKNPDRNRRTDGDPL